MRPMVGYGNGREFYGAQDPGDISGTPTQLTGERKMEYESKYEEMVVTRVKMPNENEKTEKREKNARMTKVSSRSFLFHLDVSLIWQPPQLSSFTSQ